MNIICAILTGFGYLVRRVRIWARRVKISKKSRRNMAVFFVCAIAVAAVAFSFRRVNSGGRNRSSALERKSEAEEIQKEPEETEDSVVFGLDSIMQGMLISQDTQSEVLKVGTSFEMVLVGQRRGRRRIASHLDFAEAGLEDVKFLKNKALGISEKHLLMSEEDYNTLLRIVEAEAGGEDIKGKILVANVIFNRVKNPKFPSNVTDVVWEKVAGSSQFSPTEDGRIHTVVVSEETKEAVNRAIDGEDYSKGALFFVEESYADKKNVAWFKKDLKFLFEYGVHDFYTYP